MPKDMRKIIFVTCLFLSFVLQAQDKKTDQNSQIVEVSCGECQFGMKGKGCDLAIRINGKSYFVDGTKIDDHGNAHAKDGFCETIRKAEIIGEIIDDRFKVTSFTLLPEKQ
jgi:hypothetical protein